jgi:hypothetical protein
MLCVMEREERGRAMEFKTAVCEVKGGSEKRTGGDCHPCPCCGGTLVPMRGTMRCGRCAFTLCFGCDPVMGGADAPQADD